jgi:hypothetical protein
MPRKFKLDGIRPEFNGSARPADLDDTIQRQQPGLFDDLDREPPPWKDFQPRIARDLEINYKY